MARKQAVNRGVMITRCRCKIVDTVTNIVSEEEFDLAGKLSQPEKILKGVRNKFETERIKIVQLLQSYTEKVVYSMPLEDFMRQAEMHTGIYADTDSTDEEVQPNE